MYGENSGMLRAELAVLLRHHRIQQRLGGKGIHTVPETTTVQEREDLGRQIARYRHSVLLWSLQASRAANPWFRLENPRGRSLRPAEELHHRLTEAVRASTAGLPLTEELTSEQRFPIVESWRLAARAAALGEHDFGAGIEYSRLSDDQRMTVLKDAAEIARAIVGLDRRYEGIPGWEKLKDQGRLCRAAEVCAAFAGYDEPDYTVDRLGWRPEARLDHGPAVAGFGGIVQGEYNLLVALKRFPDVQSMRLVLDSQRIVSQASADVVRKAHPLIAQEWDERAATYKEIISESRNLRGTVGSGSESAGYGSIVASRAQKLTSAEDASRTQVRQLNRLLNRIDARLADILERGVTEHHYLLRVKLQQMAERSDGLVHPVDSHYVPINAPVQTDLLPMVRERLRPTPEPQPAPRGATQSRIDFEAALAHRPGDPGPTLAL
jgi:hypothetical protein